MQKQDAEVILKGMIECILLYLDELKEFQNCEKQQFQYGERTAYTECLEWIQLWAFAEENGLDFDIEKRYPL